MKTKPFPDFNTPAGIRAVADHLAGLANDPVNWDAGRTEDHHIGHLRIRPSYLALTESAEKLRRGAPDAGKKRGGVWQTPTRMDPPSHYGEKPSLGETVAALDAVRFYGTPEAGLAAIRRQLSIQGESMDPADVKRCERAAMLIEHHIEHHVETTAREAALEAENDALLARIEAGTEPGMDEILPEGTAVKVTHKYQDCLGTVLKSKIGPHPILGKGHPIALHTVRVSHVRETRAERYAFYPTKPTVLKRVNWKDVRVLAAPCPVDTFFS